MSTSGTFTADGQSDTEKVRGDNGVHVHISGDFGSGTAKVQFKTKETTPVWKTIANTSITANDDLHLQLLHGMEIRIDLASSTNPTLYWHIYSANR